MVKLKNSAFEKTLKEPVGPNLDLAVARPLNWGQFFFRIPWLIR